MTMIDDDGNEIDVDRTTMASLNDKNGKIYIDSKYFKLSSQARRDAVLHHEIAHTKFHSRNPESNKMDKEMMNKETIIRILEVGIEEKASMHGIKKSDPEFNKFRKDQLRECEPLIKKYANNIPNDNSGRQKIRAEALSIFKKYDKGGHANISEFEADLYGANKTSKKSMKGAIRELDKLQRKEDAKQRSKGLNVLMQIRDSEYNPPDLRTKKGIRERVQKQKSTKNTSYQVDYNQRSKALNDKSLTQKQKQNYR